MLLGILSCKETLLRLDDYIDRELSPRETQLVARHLKICHQCAQRFAFETDLVEGLRLRLERIEAPADLLAKIRVSLDEAEKKRCAAGTS